MSFSPPHSEPLLPLSTEIAVPVADSPAAVDLSRPSSSQVVVGRIAYGLLRVSVLTAVFGLLAATPVDGATDYGTKLGYLLAQGLGGAIGFAVWDEAFRDLEAHPRYQSSIENNLNAKLAYSALKNVVLLGFGAVGMLGAEALVHPIDAAIRSEDQTALAINAPGIFTALAIPAVIDVLRPQTSKIASVAIGLASLVCVSAALVPAVDASEGAVMALAMGFMAMIAASAIMQQFNPLFYGALPRPSVDAVGVGTELTELPLPLATQVPDDAGAETIPGAAVAFLPASDLLSGDRRPSHADAAL